MIVSIMGKRWNLRFTSLRKNNGECDSPKIKGKEIRINSKLKGELLLDTIIHECLHAAGWHEDEECVEQKGEDLARILWRLGYRRQD